MATTIPDNIGITGLPATSASGAPTTGSNKLGKDEFLKLFMAQLAHQDPTAPVDSNAFIAQLAQFASLEAQQTTNQSLEALMLGQAAAQQTGVTSLVGKDVLFKTDSLTLGPDGGGTVSAHLASDAGSVTAVINDANGRAVRTIKLGPQSAGDLAIAWDGRDDNGNRQPAGVYKVNVTAADKTGAPLAVEQRGQAHVDGVSFQNGFPELIIGMQRVKLSDVTEIHERTTP